VLRWDFERFRREVRVREEGEEKRLARARLLRVIILLSILALLAGFCLALYLLAGGAVAVMNPQLPLALLMGSGFLLLYYAANWVYGDARKRGMLAGFWSLLVLLCPPIILAYLAVRGRWSRR